MPAFHACIHTFWNRLDHQISKAFAEPNRKFVPTDAPVTTLLSVVLSTAMSLVQLVVISPSKVRAFGRPCENMAVASKENVDWEQHAAVGLDAVETKF